MLRRSLAGAVSITAVTAAGVSNGTPGQPAAEQLHGGKKNKSVVVATQLPPAAVVGAGTCWIREPLPSLVAGAAEAGDEGPAKAPLFDMLTVGRTATPQAGPQQDAAATAAVRTAAKGTAGVKLWSTGAAAQRSFPGASGLCGVSAVFSCRLASSSGTASNPPRTPATQRSLSDRGYIAELRNQAAKTAAAKAPSGGSPEAWRKHMSGQAQIATFNKVFEMLQAGKDDVARDCLSICMIGDIDLEERTGAINAILADLKGSVCVRPWFEGADQYALTAAERTSVVAKFAASAKFKERHIEPHALGSLWTSDAGLGDTLRSCTGADPKVLVLHGPSGSGKTLAALMVARELEALRKVPKATTVYHMYVRDGSVSDAVLDAEPGSDKVARNRAAFDLVLTAVKEAIPMSNRRAPTGAKRRHDMVLVLDELGPSRGMVRGIIAEHVALRAAIKREVNCTGSVHIVIAGTGVEGIALDVGSSTDDYEAVRVQVPVWDTVSKHLPKEIKTFVRSSKSPTAELVRGLVTNARCAALFAKTSADWHRRSGATMSDETMKLAAAEAVLGYRRRNGLRKLKHSQVVCAIMSAMAAQMSDDGAALPVGLGDLKARFGLLVDNGRLKKDSDGMPLDEVETPPGKPRYEVVRAFEAMLQVVIGIGHRPPTGEGFEQAFADFLMMAMTFAGLSALTPCRKTSDPALLAWKPLHDMLTRCKVATDVPQGWCVPLRLVSWVQEQGGGRWGYGAAVQTHQLSRKVEPYLERRAADRARRKKHYAAVRKAIKACFGARRANVWINGAQAMSSDVVGQMVGPARAVGPEQPAASKLRYLLSLCQTKLYPLSRFRVTDMLFELNKMGCEAEIVYAGAWAHQVSAADLRVATGTAAGAKDTAAVVVAIDGVPVTSGRGVEREALIGLIAKGLRKTKGMTFAEWLKKKLPKLAAGCLEEQGRERSERAALMQHMKRAISTTAGAVQVCFVVAVYGKVSAVPEDVAALLPKEALLLHDAPCRVTGAQTPSTARRIRGFYPVHVAYNDGGAGPRLCVLPKPETP